MAGPLVGIVMGSDSDWSVMKHAADLLVQFGVAHESRVVSAHRTPDLLYQYAGDAAGRGLRCIIAGAGGAAHLPGMLAAKTAVPVLGVPVPSKHLNGLDSLLSIVQMPGGIPVATFAIGDAGAKNAGLFAVAMLARTDAALASKLDQFRSSQTERVLGIILPEGHRVILPGATLGLVGGGQLGRMFTQAAQRMGYDVIVLDPDPQSPAAKIAGRHIKAPYTDERALIELGRAARAVTTEFENVPATTLAYLRQYCPVRPGPEAVAVTQDRITEKNFARSNGLMTAPFLPILNDDDLEVAIESIGFPAILKTSRMGYDGKGQATVDSPSALQAAFVHFGRQPCVLERRLRLDREISVVLTRGEDGRTATLPVAENRHVDGILDSCIIPARIPEKLAERARHAAVLLATAMNYVGTMAVEFFVVEGDQLLVNELAPRPHNSGHYSIDACVTDQFEQQVRAMTGMPLGDPALLSPAAMVNLLGDLWNRGEPRWERALEDPGIKLHLYGKRDPRPGRKMGHITALAATPEDALAAAFAARGRLVG